MSALDLALAAVSADDLHGSGAADLLSDAHDAAAAVASMDPADTAYLWEHGIDPLVLAAWVLSTANRRRDVVDVARSGPVKHAARPRYFVDEHGYLRQG